MVRKNEDNPKALWNSIKKVLHRSPELYSHIYYYQQFDQHFGKYFANKIAKLWSGLLFTDADPPVPGSYKNKFIYFRTMSEDKIFKISV